MTVFKTVRFGIYTALALGANSILAADLPADWVNYQIGEAPKPVVTAEFSDIEEATITIGQITKDAPDGKVFVLNFWATWCGPCRVEMPGLSKLQAEADPTEVEVITVATGRNPAPMIARFFARAEIDNLPHHRDPSRVLADAYDVIGLPVTVVLNSKGQEIARMQGEAEWGTAEAQAYLVELGN